MKVELNMDKPIKNTGKDEELDNTIEHLKKREEKAKQLLENLVVEAEEIEEEELSDSEKNAPIFDKDDFDKLIGCGG